MIAMNRCLRPLTFALALSAFASPSFAQTNADHMTAARAAALRECSLLEQKYSEYPWGNTGYFEYLACMSAHGQPE